MGEEITPNHAYATDRVNRHLHLRVGDVIWYARRPATPEVSVFCRESIGSVSLRHLLVSRNFPRHPSFHTLQLLSPSHPTFSLTPTGLVE